jgi:hypothetical protein
LIRRTFGILCFSVEDYLTIAGEHGSKVNGSTIGILLDLLATTETVGDKNSALGSPSDGREEYTFCKGL